LNAIDCIAHFSSKLKTLNIHGGASLARSKKFKEYFSRLFKVSSPQGGSPFNPKINAPPACNVAPACQCLSERKNAVKLLERKYSQPSTHTHIPLSPKFFFSMYKLPTIPNQIDVILISFHLTQKLFNHEFLCAKIEKKNDKFFHFHIDSNFSSVLSVSEALSVCVC
jgi:hypothetical protein